MWIQWHKYVTHNERGKHISTESDDCEIHKKCKTADMFQFSNQGIWVAELVIYATSAALRVGLQAYCPPAMTNEFQPDALTKTIYGRGVRRANCTGNDRDVDNHIRPASIFRPNHSMVLYRHRKLTQHNIDLTSTPAASGPPLTPAQSDRPLTPTSDI